MLDQSTFADRHIGPDSQAVAAMLAVIGVDSLDELAAKAVPAGILDKLTDGDAPGLDRLPPAASEAEALAELRALADTNTVAVSMIGQGYYDTLTPPVLLRNIMENPAWYTAYTPYQPEISQGRLEALLNFQTMVADLTGLEIANASMLDEGTAAAEAMTLMHRAARGGANRLAVDADVFAQTAAVLATRAKPLGIEIVTADLRDGLPDGEFFGVIAQLPGASGRITDWSALVAQAHERGALVAVGADLLACTLITPPGEIGADVAFGTTQRFGVPMGFGGPHAGYLARAQPSMPGSCRAGWSACRWTPTASPAYRLALQTREQHIRRDKATSNICTAQVLLAVMAAMYASYHGADGLTAIARRVHPHAAAIAAALGDALVHDQYFDTVLARVPGRADEVLAAAKAQGINLWRVDADHVSVACDEATTEAHVAAVLDAFGVAARRAGRQRDRYPHLGVPDASRVHAVPHRNGDDALPAHAGGQGYRLGPQHDSARLVHDEAQRRRRDGIDHLAGVRASASVRPGLRHARAAPAHRRPGELAGGHHRLRRGLAATQRRLARRVRRPAGDPRLPRQPGRAAPRHLPHPVQRTRHQRSVGRAGRAAGGRGGLPRRSHGDVDLDDLRAKVAEHADRLSALMITYPSTHGVYEHDIADICAAVHDAGGQVYIDGANLNALVGLARPGKFGGDVSHLNLHKTFCIPHGGGGPGVGPVAARSHLAPFLPGHPYAPELPEGRPVSSAPYGSASILPITWAYIRMMGADGLRAASLTAIASANYIARRLDEYFPVLYTGENGMVAHECILDLRAITKSTGVTVDDVAKRLADYGFHAPTMSFPVAGTLMVEPTESESLAELDAFCEAMIAIRGEIDRVGAGEWTVDDNPLRGAPHTAECLLVSDWDHPYTREEAAYPLGKAFRPKVWPPVRRIDGAYGDRNLVCSCPPVEAYS